MRSLFFLFAWKSAPGRCITHYSWGQTWPMVSPKFWLFFIFTFSEWATLHLIASVTIFYTILISKIDLLIFWLNWVKLGHFWHKAMFGFRLLQEVDRGYRVWLLDCKYFLSHHGVKHDPWSLQNFDSFSIFTFSEWATLHLIAFVTIFYTTLISKIDLLIFLT